MINEEEHILAAAAIHSTSESNKNYIQITAKLYIIIIDKLNL